MGVATYFVLFVLVALSKAHIEKLSDVSKISALMVKEYKELKKANPVRNVFAKREAEYEATGYSQPLSRSKVARNCSTQVLLIVPATVEFQPNKITPGEAFRKILKRDKKLLDSWLNGTDVTGFGVTCLIFYPEESSTTSKIAYYQFFIATTNGNQAEILRKGEKEFRDTTQKLINDYRELHRSGPLHLFDNSCKFNPRRQEMVSSAQIYVERLITRREPITFSIDAVDDRCQESLLENFTEFGVPFAGTAATYICEKWYQEHTHYNFHKPNPRDSDSFWNFVLMVWNSSMYMDLGISYGIKIHNGSQVNVVYIIARYFEPSTFADDTRRETYIENVKPRTESQ